MVNLLKFTYNKKIERKFVTIAYKMKTLLLLYII